MNCVTCQVEVNAHVCPRDAEAQVAAEKRLYVQNDTHLRDQLKAANLVKSAAEQKYEKISNLYCDLADTCVMVMKELGHFEGFEPSTLHPDQIEGCLRRVTKERDDANRLNEVRHRELIRVTNMLNTAVPHGPADPDDPCPADCRRCALEKKYPEKRKCPSTYSHGTHGKLTCEKDVDHLNRVGDVEHYSRNVKWMSV